MNSNNDCSVSDCIQYNFISNLPLDVQQFIVEFFGRDEWTDLKATKIFSNTLNFNKIYNFQIVEIIILPNGILSKPINKYDVSHRFIVSSDTIKHINTWKNIISEIVINMKISRFDTVPNDIIFRQLILSNTYETYLENIGSNNGSLNDDDYGIGSDINDDYQGNYESDNETHELTDSQDIIISELPNLKKIYIGRKNNFNMVYENIPNNIPVYWLDSGLFEIIP